MHTSGLQNSPNNLSGISNPPGTPRDDGELSGNFLHSFQSENVSISITSLDCSRSQRYIGLVAVWRAGRGEFGLGKAVFQSSSLCVSIVLSNHDDERVTPPPNHPTLFAIIPRIRTQNRIRPNTSAPNQAPFWFQSNVRMLIWTLRNPNGRRLVAQNEGHLSPFITTPCDKNQLLKMHTWHVLCCLQSPPPSAHTKETLRVPSTPERRKKKKMVEVYLLYFLTIDCGARCAGNMSAFVT